MTTPCWPGSTRTCGGGPAPGWPGGWRRQTCAWMIRELQTEQGGFASALDADSEGEEGKFYAWTPGELREVLGADDGEYAAQVFGVTEDGTFEHGSSVLQLRADPADADRLARIRAALLAARERRVRPARDDKVVAAWNGLAIAALAEAGLLLDRPEFVAAARSAAAAIASVQLADGRLARTSRDGIAGSSAGVLDDYACVADGFLALSGVTGEAGWVRLAGQLLDTALDRFGDGAGGFYDTADDGEQLIYRPADPADGPSPSGAFAAAGALLSYAGADRISAARRSRGRGTGAAARHRVEVPARRRLGPRGGGGAPFRSGGDRHCRSPRRPADRGAARNGVLCRAARRGHRPRRRRRAGAGEPARAAGPGQPLSRCWPAASWSAAGPRPTSAGTSPAACRLPNRSNCGPNSTPPPDSGTGSPGAGAAVPGTAPGSRSPSRSRSIPHSCACPPSMTAAIMGTGVMDGCACLPCGDEVETEAQCLLAEGSAVRNLARRALPMLGVGVALLTVAAARPVLPEPSGACRAGRRLHSAARRDPAVGIGATGEYPFRIPGDQRRGCSPRRRPLARCRSCTGCSRLTCSSWPPRRCRAARPPPWRGCRAWSPPSRSTRPGSRWTESSSRCSA